MEMTTMWAVPVFEILIALGLINVWLVRFNRSTAYRGAKAKNMQEEFAAYGLPRWSVYVVGFCKLSIALVMMLTVLAPQAIMPMITTAALGLLAVLMLGAVTMHIKVKDSLLKMLPALGMLSMAVYVLLLG